MTDTVAFTEKLAAATEGNFQITTDGFAPYKDAVVYSLGAQKVDFAQLVKIYTNNPENETRYSPAECTGAKKVSIYGSPDPAKVCTSHVERQNLNMRMGMPRLTRLTNAFSKKWSKLYAMLALYFGYYNLCRVHSSLRVTPAMEAGVTDHVWTLRQLLAGISHYPLSRALDTTPGFRHNAPAFIQGCGLMNTREPQLGLNNNSVSDRESRWFRFFNFFSTAKEAGGATA
jgi:hypothetical protein